VKVSTRQESAIFFLFAHGVLPKKHFDSIVVLKVAVVTMMAALTHAIASVIRKRGADHAMLPRT
jgi:hypothetical protein